jgi:cysteine desulfurase
MPAYLDCNATTPVEDEVAEAVVRYTRDEYGNAGSRTHEFGAHAKQAVQKARDQVRAVVDAEREEILFTSGATESDNLAILGLAAEGEKRGKRHIVTTAIEHKAVLEPIEHLAGQGFESTILPVDNGGRVKAEDVLAAVRDDTLLVSVMHVNNESGVIQPIDEIVAGLAGNDVYLHVDAAQSFGKEISTLKSKRIDLISISGHKIYGPKGVGVLVARRRGYKTIPLRPLMFGGGQERGLRPGTMPVPLAVGLGVAAEIAAKQHKQRAKRCMEIRKVALEELAPLEPVLHGDPDYVVPHVLNISLPGIDAEAAMLALKGIAAVSNGSACTSHSYTPSHVLEAMGLDADEISTALRISWCHLTEDVNWSEIRDSLMALRR